MWIAPICPVLKDAINLQTQNSSDLIPKFQSVATVLASSVTQKVNSLATLSFLIMRRFLICQSSSFLRSGPCAANTPRSTTLLRLSDSFRVHVAFSRQQIIRESVNRYRERGERGEMLCPRCSDPRKLGSRAAGSQPCAAVPMKNEAIIISIGSAAALLFSTPYSVDRDDRDRICFVNEVCQKRERDCRIASHTTAISYL